MPSSQPQHVGPKAMQNASPAALAAMQPLMMPSSQQFVPSAVQNAAHAAFAATQPFMMPSSQPQHVGPNAVQNASPAALAATQPLMMQNSQTPGISAKNVVQPLPSFEGFNSQFGSFDDVLSQDLPENELLEKVKAYVQDVLKSLGGDKAEKQRFAGELSKHPWFPHSGYEVRYKVAAGTVEVALSLAGRQMRQLKRKMSGMG
ncbi:Intraflagellar transport protein 25 [Durusdinium trenchii]|uniref:Intraflagellar transport protein 25 n=1 Tax=Durusdinium trenchii TaxID=1381693 RepID=A0ABP0NUV9_9DINO